MHNRTVAAESRLIVQNHVGQQFRSHRKSIAVIINESHRPEFVHEVSNAGPRGAHHFGEGLVTEDGHFGIGHCIVLAHTGEFQQNTRQPFLAVIEKLIAQIFLEIDVAH